MQRTNWSTRSRAHRPSKREIMRDQLQEITTLRNKSYISTLGSFLFGFRESGGRLFRNETGLHTVVRIGGVNRHRGGRENPADGDGDLKLHPSFRGILDTFRQGGLDNLFVSRRAIVDNHLMPADVATHAGIHNEEDNPDTLLGDIHSAAVRYPKILLAFSGFVGYTYWRFKHELATSDGSTTPHLNFNFTAAEVDALDRLSMNIWIAFTFGAQGGAHWKVDPRRGVVAFADRPRPLNSRQTAAEVQRQIRAHPRVRALIASSGASSLAQLRSDATAWAEITRITQEIMREVRAENKRRLRYGAITLLDYIRDHQSAGLTLNDIRNVITFRDTTGHRRDFLSSQRRVTSALKMGIILTAVEEEQIAWAASRAGTPSPSP